MACLKIVSCSKKFQVYQHTKRPSHTAKANRMISDPVQSKLKQYFGVYINEKDGQSEFSGFIQNVFGCNIPLNKLTNAEYSKFNAPHESALRKNVVVVDEIKNEIASTTNETSKVG